MTHRCHSACSISLHHHHQITSNRVDLLWRPTHSHSWPVPTWN